ncbi:patatin-like phospholipase family protein [bacterium]|nr:patatin-like phospholipase family protein [bacterium]
MNETRHAYGRTALLLSGGAAFGVKHLGVIAALHRENLLPRIVCGTSAGSIVAATVCVKSDQEIVALSVEHGARTPPRFGEGPAVVHLQFGCSRAA